LETNDQVEVTSDQVEVTNDQVEVTSDQVVETSDQVEVTSDQVEETSDQVEVTIDQVFSIDYQTVAESKLKFNALVSNLNNQCIKITDLNKYGRRVLHNECENLKLYHWSEQIDYKRSNFYVSNRNNDEMLHKKAQKAYFKQTKTIEQRVLEINNCLSNMQLSSSSNCQTKKKSKALMIERDALTGPTVSVETTDYINNVILSQPERSDQQQKKRGRPKKAPVSVAISDEHRIPIIECQYNLRRRNNLK
jgi:hypothetical protein